MLNATLGLHSTRYKKLYGSGQFLFTHTKHLGADNTGWILCLNNAIGDAFPFVFLFSTLTAYFSLPVIPSDSCASRVLGKEARRRSGTTTFPNV